MAIIHSFQTIIGEAGYSHGLGDKVVNQHKVFATKVVAELILGNVPQTISQSRFTIGHRTGNSNTGTRQC